MVITLSSLYKPKKKVYECRKKYGIPDTSSKTTCPDANENDRLKGILENKINHYSFSTK